MKIPPRLCALLIAAASPSTAAADAVVAAPQPAVPVVDGKPQSIGASEAERLEQLLDVPARPPAKPTTDVVEEMIERAHRGDDCPGCGLG